MGIQKSLIQTQPLSLQAIWDHLYFDYGACVLANKHNPNLQIERNFLIISNEKEIQLAIELGKLRKNDPFLVNIISFEVLTNSKLSPGSVLAAVVYNERIPIRLSHLSSIPFPDVLHMYSQAILGFENLIRYFGYFVVNESCLGVNLEHIVKVWHNPNFASLQPFETAFSEEQMINSILITIQRCIDSSLMPREEPNFRCFLYKQKDSHSFNFEYVKLKLWEYSRHFNKGQIPKYLKFIKQQNGPLSLRHKDEQYYKSRLTMQTGLGNTLSTTQNTTNLNKIYTPSTNLHAFDNRNLNIAKTETTHLFNNKISPIGVLAEGSKFIDYERKFGSLRSSNMELKNELEVFGCIHKEPTIRIIPQPRQSHSNFINFPPPSNQNYSNIRTVSNPPSAIISPLYFKPQYPQHISAPSKPTIIRIESNGLLLKQITSQSSETPHLANSKTNFTKSTIFESKSVEELDLRKRPISERNNHIIQSHIVQRFGQRDHQGDSNRRVINRELKPSMIKQSIQGHIKKDYQKPIANFQHIKMNLEKHDSQLQSSVQSPYFGRGDMHQQRIQATEQQIQNGEQAASHNQLANIYIQKRNSLQQKRPQTLINISKLKCIKDQIGQAAAKKELNMNKNDSPRSGVPADLSIGNDSFSSIGPVFTRQNTQKIFYEAREAESVNNSIRYFNSSALHDEYSQIMELSSPLDFKLKERMVPKQFIKEQPFDNGMTSSKIIDANPQWDLTQQIKTVRNDLNDIEEIRKKSARSTSKHRSSGSKQFRGELAKLGFEIPEDSASQRDSQRILTEGVIMQPNHNEQRQESQKNNMMGSKWQMNRILFKVNDKYENIEMMESPKFPSYSTSTKPSTFQHCIGDLQGNYKFEWDPQLLADMQQSAINQ